MVWRVLAVCVFVYLVALAGRIYIRNYYIWLPDYPGASFDAPDKTNKPVHIFLLYADHFEPGLNFNRVQRWVDEYPKLASRHRDSTGRVVQLTWFYPVEQPIDRNLSSLHSLVAGGYGEVELHLHHGFDSRESALLKYRNGISYLQRFGFVKTVDGQTRFAFIHGNNGLDNSLGNAYCGVNRELELLRELGCFADFTFPTVRDRSQPPFPNRIYEATDDDRPKSYDRGVPLRVGATPAGDLLIFPGPLRIVPSINPAKLFFSIEDGNVHPAVPLTESRVDAWIRSAVHVEGKPGWLFVKIYTHSAESDAYLNETLGPHFDQALAYLERRYNDGVNYVLHYVTAREAFNLARAAAADQRGDPSRFLNWIVPPYVADRKQ